MTVIFEFESRSPFSVTDNCGYGNDRVVTIGYMELHVCDSLLLKIWTKQA